MICRYSGISVRRWGPRGRPPSITPAPHLRSCRRPCSHAEPPAHDRMGGKLGKQRLGLEARETVPGGPLLRLPPRSLAPEVGPHVGKQHAANRPARYRALLRSPAAAPRSLPPTPHGAPAASGLLVGIASLSLYFIPAEDKYLAQNVIG